MASFPIIRRVRNFQFDLQDLLDFYRHLPVHTTKGMARVLEIDRVKDIVTVRLVKTKEIVTFRSRQLKLLLRPLSTIKGKDLQIIANLAADTNYSNFTVRRNNTKIECINQKYFIEIFIKKEFSIKAHKIKRIKEEGEEEIKMIPMDSNNLGFISSYLAMRGFDMFELLSTTYAKFSKAAGP